MSFKPTGAPDVVKPPMFVEELVEGTLPLNDGLPTPGPTIFRSCGLVTALGKDIDVQMTTLRPLGFYDTQRQIKLGEQQTSTLQFHPFDFDLMKYGLNVADLTTPANAGAGPYNETVGVSISILMSALIDGVEKYRIYKGVKFASMSLEISKANGFVVSMPFRAREITEWIAQPTFAPAATFATLPAGEPWSGITSGPDPLKIDATAYPTTSFTADFDMGMNYYESNGQTTFDFSKAFKRDITLGFDTLVRNNTLIGDLGAFDTHTVEYTIHATGPKKLTFNNVRFNNYAAPLEGDSTNFATETFQGHPEGASGNNAVTIGDS